MPLHNIEKQSKEQIAKALPSAIETALLSYQMFTISEQTMDAADYKKHHEAAKAALTHIELLTKLAQWASQGLNDEVSQRELAIMIEAAQKEIDNSRGRNNE